jgi:hypothetical protein
MTLQIRNRKADVVGYHAGRVSARGKVMENATELRDTALRDISPGIRIAQLHHSQPWALYELRDCKAVSFGTLDDQLAPWMGAEVVSSE